MKSILFKTRYHRPPRVVLCLNFLFMLVWLPASTDLAIGQGSAQSLRVGVAVTDITPAIGYAHYRGASTGVKDPLKAKALVFQQGNERAALVMCDLIRITRDLSQAVRGQASERTGIPYANIFLAATHSHTTPRYLEDMAEYARAREGQPAEAADRQSYPAYLIQNMVEAVVQADSAVRPAELKSGFAHQEGLSFNRRFLMSNGKVRFNPGLQNPDIVRPMGPIDPEVGILLLGDPGGEPLAALTVFALHLDTVGGREYSADYPHYLAESLKHKLGQDFVSIFGAGPCGNINHLDVSGSDRLQTRYIGKTLAETVQASLPDLHPVEEPALGVRSRVIFAPLQDYTPEELEWAKSGTDEPLYPEREFLQLRRRMKILSLEELRQSEAIPPSTGNAGWTLPVEVQVFRLGKETALVALPGEVFVELGLSIKEQSPFEKTFVIELANININYVPDREAFSQGDYEAINSRLAPGGGELMVEAAVEMLKELKMESNSR